MQIKKTLLCLGLTLCVATVGFAQEEERKPKKGAQRAAKTTTTQMMKFFKSAELTEEQQGKAKAIIEEQLEGLLGAKKALDGLLTKEQRQKRQAAFKKAKEEGLKGNKANAKALEAMGLSDEELKAFDEAKKKVDQANAKMKSSIMELLSDEQKTTFTKPKKAKGEKGKKVDKAKTTPEPTKTQTVSLNLPGMTCGGCERSVRAALTKSVDGITNLATDPKDHSCSFDAPAGVNVKAILDKIADGGNAHVKNWAFVEKK